MSSQVVHFEIMGPDGDALARFYRDVFGWDPVPLEGFDGYHGVDAEDVGAPGGAVGQTTEMPPYVTLYLEVDEIDAALADVGKAGGTTVVSKQVIPGVVTFAMFRDPAGNLLGLAESQTPESD